MLKENKLINGETIRKVGNHSLMGTGDVKILPSYQKFRKTKEGEFYELYESEYFANIFLKGEYEFAGGREWETLAEEGSLPKPRQSLIFIAGAPLVQDPRNRSRGLVYDTGALGVGRAHEGSVNLYGQVVYVKAEKSTPVDTYTKKEFDDLLKLKENTLKNKETIKSVDEQEILGQGNIEIKIE